MAIEPLNAIKSLGDADFVLILPTSLSRSYTGLRYSLSSAQST